MSREFIELNRTFSELSPNSEDLVSENWLYLLGEKDFDWQYLINQNRVVILSEAGSGKTEEIRNATINLIAKGKYAFFLRLEHLSANFDIAFEEGSLDKFVEWENSIEEGWIFLDSVDESRLRNPQDFEVAVRQLAARLGAAKQRTHIVITGRISGWRPVTDLALCNKLFPFLTPLIPCEPPSEEDVDAVKPLTKENDSTFRIFSINELNLQQVEQFSIQKGVSNLQKFLDSIERADAEIHTKRPLDLEELVEFWTKHKKIGSRLELMMNSIDKRLTERDENRAILHTIAESKLLEGAKMVAAASILANDPTIQIPDGSHNASGLPIRKLLPNWSEAECSILLSRPIFDKAIYGTVRFYHRSVREYLAARWFSDRLKDPGSRRKIEGIFFSYKYGIPVIVPTMRPVLPWLAILDEKVRNRVCKYFPDVLFEGGDPSQLPLEIRKQVLSDVCVQLSQGEPCRSIQSIDAIQRFANSDLADVISDFLTRSPSNPNLQWFLLRMIWQGQIKELVPVVHLIALNELTEVDARIAAVKVVLSFGTSAEIEALKHKLNTSKVIDRQLLAELIYGVEPTKDNIDWIFGWLDKAKSPKRRFSETLTDTLESWITKADITLLPYFIEKGSEFLEREPIFAARYCEVSKQYFWLISPLAIATERLIIAKDQTALATNCLSVLRKIPLIRLYDPDGYNPIKIDFRKHIGNWEELKYALFWHIVEAERAAETANGGGRLIYHGQCDFNESFVSFGENDLDSILKQINLRSFLDDKFIALSIANSIYLKAEKSQGLLDSIKKITDKDSLLTDRLKELNTPIQLTTEQKEARKKSEYWKSKNAKMQKCSKLMLKLLRTQINI